MEKMRNYTPPEFSITQVLEDVITQSTDNFGQYIEEWYED